MIWDNILTSSILLKTMYKLVKSILVSALLYSLPLWLCGKWPTCYNDFHFVLLFLFTVLVQFSQPDVTVDEIIREAKTDKYTTLYIYFAGLSSQLLAVVEWVKHDTHTIQLNWAMFSGLTLLTFGFYIRIVSRTILDKNFTSSVVKIENGQLTTTGIYGTIRHLSYKGAYSMYWFNTISTNIHNAIFTTIALLLAYAIRIKYEEVHLKEYYGTTYESYVKNTWRLIPYIY